ncbi:MAG: hypothetical protein ACREBW_05430, partial [Candidatus Micrarchaeaceae archaeon]
NIPADLGKVTVPSKAFVSIYRYYRQFEAWTIAVVAGTVVMFVAAALLSVNHGKTIRRILMTGGVLALLQGLLLALPWLVTIPRIDPTTEAAVKAIVEQVIRNFMLLSLAVGGGMYCCGYHQRDHFAVDAPYARCTWSGKEIGADCAKECLTRTTRRYSFTM